MDSQPSASPRRQGQYRETALDGARGRSGVLRWDWLVPWRQTATGRTPAISRPINEWQTTTRMTMTQPDLFGALPPPPRKLTNLDLAKIAFTEFREALRASIHQPPTDPRQLLQIETDVQFALRSRFGDVPKTPAHLAALCIRGIDVFMCHEWQDGQCRRCKRISK